MDFYSNFDNKHLEDVKQCLQIANISDYRLMEAADIYGEKLEGFFALYLPSEVAKDPHAIAVFSQAMHALRQALALQYNEMGYSITENKARHLHLGITKEEIEKLSNDIAVISFSKGDMHWVLDALIRFHITELDTTFPDPDTCVLVMPQLCFEKQRDNISLFQEAYKEMDANRKEKWHDASQSEPK